MPKVITNSFSLSISPSGFEGSYDEYGIRDPSFLIDEEGNQLLIDGERILYATCSKNNGMTQWSGAFSEAKERFSFCNLVLEASDVNDWDSGMKSTPHVIQVGDEYYLYYRGGKAPYDDAIGLRVSKHPLDFSKSSGLMTLSHSDFSDMPISKPLQMGLPYVIKAGKKLVMMFEGSSISQGSAQIFGAVSDNGFDWSPLNNGLPLLGPKNFNLPNTSYANPRFVYLPNHDCFVLAFNASGEEDRYYLGLAHSSDLVNWSETVRYLIYPFTNITADNPLSGRLEGGIIGKSDSEKLFEFHIDQTDASDLEVIFMAIPAKGPSHRNSAIYKSRSNISFVASAIFDIDTILCQQLEGLSSSITSFQKDKLTFELLSSQTLDAPASLALEGVHGDINFDLDISTAYRAGASVKIFVAETLSHHLQKNWLVKYDIAFNKYKYKYKYIGLFIKKILNKLIRKVFRRSLWHLTKLCVNGKEIQGNKLSLSVDCKRVELRCEEERLIHKKKPLDRCCIIIECSGLPVKGNIRQSGS